MVVQVDSREQKNNNVLDYFDNIGQPYIVSKMISGDYQDVNSVKTLIDLKQSHGDGVAELCANLTKTNNHQRFRNEIDRARLIGCERFIVLIVSNKIDCVDDIHTWENKRGQVKPETLEKIVKTFIDKYGIEVVFCKKNEVGAKIVELLTDNTKHTQTSS